MADSADAEVVERLREEFRQVVDIYNAAVKSRKVRAIRPAAETAHRTLYALSETVRTSHPNQIALLTELEAALMDVRWGRFVGRESC